MTDDFTLRTVPPQGEEEAPAADGGGLRRADAPGINASAELVADLLAATGLVSEDKLALARGRAGSSGSLAEALVDEGLATGEGIARTLAARYRLPLVDLSETGIDNQAVKELPLHVLERVVAIPYAIEGNSLRVAVADPANVHAIDELRIATRLTLELAVATRDDVEAEVRRLVRASEAFGARAVLEEEQALHEAEEESDDLEVDDG